MEPSYFYMWLEPDREGNPELVLDALTTRPTKHGEVFWHQRIRLTRAMWEDVRRLLATFPGDTDEIRLGLDQEEEAHAPSPALTGAPD